MTNMYETCSLDYIMQAFAPIFTSLSGFLEFCASAIEVVFADDSETMFLGLSLASYERDEINAGFYFGEFMVILFNVEF